MWGVREHYLGHVVSSSPLSLPQVLVREPCTKCDVLNLCGGRCLYANIMKRWDNEEYKLVCDTVRNLVDAVKAQVPRIRDLIDSRRISLKDFQYVRYNGCEIIP